MIYGQYKNKDRICVYLLFNSKSLIIVLSEYDSYCLNLLTSMLYTNSNSKDLNLNWKNNASLKI